jgi:hypothetical protein
MLCDTCPRELIAGECPSCRAFAESEGLTYEPPRPTTRKAWAESPERFQCRICGDWAVQRHASIEAIGPAGRVAVDVCFECIAALQGAA